MKEVNEKRNYMMKIFEDMPVGIIITNNSTNKIVYINK